MQFLECITTAMYAESASEPARLTLEKIRKAEVRVPPPGAPASVARSDRSVLRRPGHVHEQHQDIEKEKNTRDLELKKLKHAQVRYVTGTQSQHTSS